MTRLKSIALLLGGIALAWLSVFVGQFKWFRTIAQAAADGDFDVLQRALIVGVPLGAIMGIWGIYAFTHNSLDDDHFWDSIMKPMKSKRFHRPAPSIIVSIPFLIVGLPFIIGFVLSIIGIFFVIIDLNFVRIFLWLSQASYRWWLEYVIYFLGFACAAIGLHFFNLGRKLRKKQAPHSPSGTQNSTTVSVPPTVSPFSTDLSVQLRVREKTDMDGQWLDRLATTLNARTYRMLQFRIDLGNSGQDCLTDVAVRAQLPRNIMCMLNTVVEVKDDRSRIPLVQALDQSFITDGLHVSDIEPGGNRILEFEGAPVRCQGDPDQEFTVVCGVIASAKSQKTTASVVSIVMSASSN